MGRLEPLRGIKAVTFDVGNTLFPFRRREMDALLDAFIAFVESRMGPCDRERLAERYDSVRLGQYRVNLPRLRENDLIERLKLTLETVTEDVTPEMLGEAAEAYIEALAGALPLPPGLPALLATLKSRFRLGVISNYLYSPGTRYLLESKGIASFFDCVIVSADWAFIKPHPLLFRQAARGLGVPVTKILHVGDDWEADIIGATEAGARCVLFTGFRDEPDPARGDPRGHPEAVLDALEDLLRLVG